LDLVGGPRQKAVVQSVTADAVSYRSDGVNYQLTPSPGTGSFRQLDNGTVRISPNASGKLILNLAVAK
jgi:hypothetical protein